MLIGKTVFRESQTDREDVQRAAAADGGGAAEEGGQPQAHLRLPGRGGHQGEAPEEIFLSTILENKQKFTPHCTWPGKYKTKVKTILSQTKIVSVTLFFSLIPDSWVRGSQLILTHALFRNLLLTTRSLTASWWASPVREPTRSGRSPGPAR